MGEQHAGLWVAENWGRAERNRCKIDSKLKKFIIELGNMNPKDVMVSYKVFRVVVRVGSRVTPLASADADMEAHWHDVDLLFAGAKNRDTAKSKFHGSGKSTEKNRLSSFPHVVNDTAPQILKASTRNRDLRTFAWNFDIMNTTFFLSSSLLFPAVSLLPGLFYWSVSRLPGLLGSGLEGGWDRWRGGVLRREGGAGFPPRRCGWSSLGRASWPQRRAWRHG